MAMDQGASTSGWVTRKLAQDEAETTATKGPGTFLDAGAEFSGTMRLTQPIRIDGELQGRIESDSTVLIGESAAIEADIRARSVIVGGAVVGNVTASRELVLRTGGRIQGDVETPSLEVEKGSFLNGRTTMRRPEAGAEESAGTAASEESLPITPPSA